MVSPWFSVFFVVVVVVVFSPKTKAQRNRERLLSCVLQEGGGHSFCDANMGCKQIQSVSREF